MNSDELLKILTNLPVNESAPHLLGCRVLTSLGSFQIVEVEAYGSSDDPASHAFRGQTQRNQVMFGPAGYVYTYFNYGCHWMFNISAQIQGCAAAILIRAGVPLDNLAVIQQNRPKARTELEFLNGPGKICAAYQINKSHYGINIFDSESTLKIDPFNSPKSYVSLPRVGLASGKGDDKLWRFIDTTSCQWASNPRPKLTQLEDQTPPPDPQLRVLRLLDE